MFTISLRDFITTGKFGPVQLGITIDEVISHLGEPEGQTSYQSGESEIIYAYYEFFFSKENRILYGIQNDHLATFPNVKTKRVNNKKDICFQNDKFNIDIWFLKKNRYLTFGEVVANLEKEKVVFEVAKDYGGETMIKFESGVTMDFDDLSGLSFYHKETDSWTHADKIEEDNEKIFSGVRLYDLNLTR